MVLVPNCFDKGIHYLSYHLVSSPYQDDRFAVDNVCSRSAMVTATSSSREKSTAIITAEDECKAYLLLNI